MKTNPLIEILVALGTVTVCGAVIYWLTSISAFGSVVPGDSAYPRDMTSFVLILIFLTIGFFLGRESRRGERDEDKNS